MCTNFWLVLYLCVCPLVHQDDSRVSSLVDVSRPFAGSRTCVEVGSCGEPGWGPTCDLPPYQCKDLSSVLSHTSKKKKWSLKVLSPHRLKKQLARSLNLSPLLSWTCSGQQTFDVSQSFCGLSGELEFRNMFLFFSHCLQLTILFLLLFQVFYVCQLLWSVIQHVWSLWQPFSELHPGDSCWTPGVCCQLAGGTHPSSPHVVHQLLPGGGASVAPHPDHPA